MVHLTKIYTKTGDKGTTAVADNKRVSKTSPVIQAIGKVDEANSAIGMATEYRSDIIDRIQSDLFDLGADLAGYSTVKIEQRRIDWLENIIDDMNSYLEPLHSFVLPTGPLHFARAVVRQAEITVWSVMETQEINPLIVVYLNRLSDLLFVMARYYNKGNEKLWVPMENQ